jgi:SAM-dependent methyltransferase
MKTINTCEVCGNKTLTPVLDLGLHPLCDDLVPINDDRLCEEYPIDILFCEKCYTAHQHYQVEKQSLFSKNYHYRARMTPSVLEGMKDLVNSCEKQFGNLTGKTVLDIGCNDGSLLNYFKEKGCNTIGVEPTGAAADSVHYTINDFFDKDAVDKILLKYNSIDIITFTNVFAHIEDLNGLIANLNKLINKNTKVVIENHYIGAVLKTGQFDTFYHEHPRTYSFESFKFVAEKLNLNIVGVEFVTRYGGNIRVFMGQEIKSEVSVDETSFLSLFSTN